MADKITAVIIDDMPMAIAALEEDLKATDYDIYITGTAGSVVEGAKLLSRSDPDIVFLDIQMGDGDGFDLLEIIENKDFKVIFTTASREHAIRAFRFDAVDYLLKPIDVEMLEQAIGKALRTGLTGDKDKTGVLLLSTQEETRRVDVDDITRLESEGNYTVFYFINGEKLLLSKTLKTYEDKLPDSFMRVHQSHLVNRDHVRSFIKTEGGYLLMTDGSRVPVAVRKRSEIIDLLGA